MPWQVRANLPAQIPLRRRGGREFPANQWVTLADEEWSGPLGEAVRKDPAFSAEELNAEGVPLGAVDTQGRLVEELAEVKAECERLKAENQALTEKAAADTACLLSLRTRCENLESANQALERREKPAEEPLSVEAERRKREAEIAAEKPARGRGR